MVTSHHVIAQGFVDCNPTIEGPELPGGATLCELVDDFDSTPRTFGVNASSITYWSSTGIGIPYPYGLSSEDIVVHGTLYIDEPCGFNTCRIKMMHNAKVIVENEAFLLSLATKWFSCEGLWYGIEVQRGGKLSAFGSHFEDARELINAEDGAQLVLHSNLFNRNYIGLTNSVASSAFAGIMAWMSYNTFSCTSELNAPPLGGGYNPPVSFAGIYLNRGTLVHNPGSFSSPNYFEYMQNGIVLENANAQLTNLHFSKMIIGPGVSGTGIYAKNSVLLVDAELFQSQNWHGRSIFIDCENGILGLSSHIDIMGAIFAGEMAGGIDSEDNRQSEYIKIRHCRVNIDDPGTVGGIWLKRGTGSGDDSHYIISYDSIVIDESHAPVIGISIEPEYPSIDATEIENNYVSWNGDEGGTAIYITNGLNDRFRINENYVESNTAYNADPYLRFAMFCAGVGYGYRNEINNNEVYGIATENSWDGGICIEDFPHTQVCNNIVDLSEIGFHLVGTNSPFEFSENDIDSHVRGLLIESGDTPGMIGTQERRNNLWAGSGDYDVYAAECTSNPLRSIFEVQNSSTGILPVPRFPGNSDWFRVVDGDTNECGENSNLDDLSNSDTLLIEDELFEDGWSEGQKWSATRQLMYKLIRFPALRPASSPAEDFYNLYISESPGLHAQAEYDYVTALLSPSGHSDIDESYEEALAWFDSISVLQSVSRDLDTLIEDSGYNGKLSYYMDTLNTILIQLETHKKTVNQDQKILMASVVANLATLPADSLYEYYFMRTLLVLGTKVLDDTISDDHLLTLDTIASDEFNTGGIAVRYARIILGACSGYQLHSHSEIEEQGLLLYDSEKPEVQDDEMDVVYDKPANVVRVLWNMPKSGELRFIDLQGRILFAVDVENQIQAEIPASTTSGLYYLHLIHKDASKSSIKSVVIH